MVCEVSMSVSFFSTSCVNKNYDKLFSARDFVCVDFNAGTNENSLIRRHEDSFKIKENYK